MSNSQVVVACVKWVATRPEIDPLTGEVTTDSRFSGLSPADLAALEWSLRIAEKRDLPVLAVTVGDEAADEGLRLALAHGATEAIRLTDGQADPSSQAVAKMLASVCTSAELVVCGDHSLDRGSGSVPAFLANELDFGQALGCVGLNFGNEPSDGLHGGGSHPEELVAERRLDQGRRELLSITGPTVLSFEGGLELRRSPLALTLVATAADIPVTPFTAVSSSASNPDQTSVRSTGPYRPRARASAAPTGTTMDRIRQLTGVGEERPTAKQLELEPPEAAKVALEQLKAWGYLDDDSDEGPQTSS